MDTRRQPGFFTLMIQLFGLEAFEQSLIETRMELGYRARMMRIHSRRAFPTVVVSMVLTLYAVVAVMLTMRRLRRAEAPSEPAPVDDAPVAEATAAVEAAV